MDFEGRGRVIRRGNHRWAGGHARSEVRRLRGPGAGVGLLRVGALLEAGAPEMNVAGGPVVAVGGVLADHDPAAGLAACERGRDLEALPGGRQRDLGWADELGGIRVVDDADRHLARAGGARAQM